MVEKMTFDRLPEAVNLIFLKLEQLEYLIQENLKETNLPEEEILLDINEAARFLNLSVPTIYSKVSKREIPFMKRSKRLYFSNLELMEYLKEGRRKTSQEALKEAENYIQNNKKGQRYE
jgi:excisionase family DNA binding protein